MLLLELLSTYKLFSIELLVMVRVLPWIRQSCKNHDGILLLISDSGSSTTTSHNLDDFISMDPTVGIGDVLHLMDFVKKFFRNWFYLEEINWLYIIQRCHFAYDIQQMLTMKKKTFWRKKSTTLMVTYYTYLKLKLSPPRHLFFKMLS